MVKKKNKKQNNYYTTQPFTIFMKQQIMNPQQQIKSEKTKEIKIKIKTVSWRSTLAPCSTRILTICSKPLKAAKWRTVNPYFKQKESC